jgi:hypothetical protein
VGELGSISKDRGRALDATRVLITARNDDDVYLDKLQTRGVKKSLLYM